LCAHPVDKQGLPVLTRRETATKRTGPVSPPCARGRDSWDPLVSTSLTRRLTPRGADRGESAGNLAAQAAQTGGPPAPCPKSASQRAVGGEASRASGTRCQTPRTRRLGVRPPAAGGSLAGNQRPVGPRSGQRGVRHLVIGHLVIDASAFGLSRPEGRWPETGREVRSEAREDARERRPGVSEVSETSSRARPANSHAGSLRSERPWAAARVCVPGALHDLRRKDGRRRSDLLFAGRSSRSDKTFAGCVLRHVERGSCGMGC